MSFVVVVLLLFWGGRGVAIRHFETWVRPMKGMLSRPLIHMSIHVLEVVF